MDVAQGILSQVAARPSIKVHGRKRSHRLSIQGQHLLEGLLPLLSVPLALAAQEPAQLFGPSCRNVWLEIGFGDGGHLAWCAAANPEIGVIGCEPYVNGVARALETIQAEGLGNIRIHPGDARDLLAVLPEKAVARVFILFPDPWPRKRHHKRRFISKENLNALAHVMQPGSELLFASDSEEYCEWTLAHIRSHPDFTEGVHERGDAPVTKYEAKARAAGRLPTYLRFVRE
ncbi:MAG: tRNA (guanosine(46)-N7)-methyltransferase TrmB [Alphaproteobacteria bacterium]